MGTECLSEGESEMRAEASALCGVTGELSSGARVRAQESGFYRQTINCDSAWSVKSRSNQTAIACTVDV